MEEKKKTRKWAWYGLTLILFIIIVPSLHNIVSNITHEVNAETCKKWIRDIPTQLDKRGGYWAEGWAYEKCRVIGIPFKGKIIVELTDEYGGDKYLALNAEITREQVFNDLVEEVGIEREKLRK